MDIRPSGDFSALSLLSVVRFTFGGLWTAGGIAVLGAFAGSVFRIPRG